ncbi:ATP-dependent DNA helicase [Campylobacter sp. RM5004]|uniref:ATP-dependent DNA helicase RecG n=1 Tax=Campylobacter sp. RM5004 TaxID=1660078 RepID=UPI001EFBD9BB|nr:ATP-dependent DNA helicase RecG [Campylobacter sp. RM5004]ULO01212.1 ATP-dependent DNA helicase [Campylobacter sp. RM5004]
MNKDLEKLACKDLIDLALLMPKKFDDLRLNDAPILNELNCTKVVIKSKKQLAGKRLTCIAYSYNWECECTITIFNARPFHNALFAINKELLIYGKLNDFAGLLQFVNPKIIKNSGEITANYMIKGVSDKSISEIKKKYLNYESLKAYDLLDEHIKLLLTMSENSVDAMLLLNSDELNECLKFVEIFHHIRRLNETYKNDTLYKKLKTHDINKWLKSLPFSPTNDQLKAILDIKSDLENAKHKIRIIMGDVGCGKSLVIFAAALMTYPNKAILMAPTSVLAQQLYEEAKRLMPGFVKILHFSGTKTKFMQDELQDANFVIGTHALLWADIGDASLVMIDEQQRFGAKQRMRLKELATTNDVNPHYIEFSATPIPRTTALINSDIYSYSFIKELPFKKEIETKLITIEQSKELFNHIRIENEKNHQAIIVYPLIEEGKTNTYKPLESVIPYYEKHFKNVYYTHGKDKEKDNVLSEFALKGDVLLSTTIIEVGISLPRLSIIVIVAPERYGLSTLHQLRGRVGRNGVKSYCYLLSKNDFSDRLIEFSKTLDGFKIAEIDLANRKSGDLIDGDYQHGASFKYFDETSDNIILQKAKEYIHKLQDK